MLQEQTAPVAPNIGPPLTFRRPKLVHYERPGGRRSQYAQAPRLESIRELECRDHDAGEGGAPNIRRFRAAIVRNKLSDGVSYLLPVDKTRVSINNNYKTDMKAIFEAPYASMSVGHYDEEDMARCSRVHFQANSHVTRLQKAEGSKNKSVQNTKGGSAPNGQQAAPVQGSKHKHCNQKGVVRLNGDSHRVLENYQRLTPRTGPHESRLRAASKSTKTSSLPPKVNTSRAEKELKQEVQVLLKSCRIELDLDDKTSADGASDSFGKRVPSSRYQDAGPGSRSTSVSKTREGSPQSRSTAVGAEHPTFPSPTPSSISSFASKSYTRRCQGYRTYKELLECPLGGTPKLPDSIRSPHLEKGKSDDIWRWLHKDRNVSSFQHFLDVCG